MWTKHKLFMIAKCSCQHCRNHIEFEAEHTGAVVPCPHCGKETTLGPPKLQVNQYGEKIAKKSGSLKRMVLIAGSAVGVFILIIVIYALSFMHDPRDDFPKDDTGTRAISYGLFVVSNSLVSPSSAKFLDYELHKSDAGYMVSGHLDSLNRYGVLVRSAFYCDLTYLNGNFNWSETMIDGEIQANPKYYH